MIEWVQSIFPLTRLPFQWPGHFFWEAIFDILVVYYLLYRGLLLLKGTQAVRVLLGLILLVGAYFMSRVLGLQTFSWILDQFFNSFVLVILIVFQEDLRRALGRVGVNIVSRSRLSEEEKKAIDELVKAAAALSVKKIGGLMVLQREADLRDHIQGGTPIDAIASEELMFSLFLPYAPLHDGAVVVHQGRLVRAGCILPLARSQEVPRSLGTRHRAAIGLTEMTDALVVVVSETDGQISFCKNGVILRELEPASLYSALVESLGTPSQKGEKPLFLTEEKESVPLAPEKSTVKADVVQNTKVTLRGSHQKAPSKNERKTFNKFDAHAHTSLKTEKVTAQAEPKTGEVIIKSLKPHPDLKKSGKFELRSSGVETPKVLTETRVKSFVANENMKRVEKVEQTAEKPPEVEVLPDLSKEPETSEETIIVKDLQETHEETEAKKQGKQETQKQTSL